MNNAKPSKRPHPKGDVDNVPSWQNAREALAEDLGYLLARHWLDVLARPPSPQGSEHDGGDRIADRTSEG